MAKQDWAEDVLTAIAEAERQVTIAIGNLTICAPRFRFTEEEVAKIRRAELDLNKAGDFFARQLHDVEMHASKTPVEAS